MCIKDRPGSVGHNLIGTVCKGQADENAKVSKIVDDFAKDPAHPYFDELADEIALQIKAGKTLQDAYETAVYANPVTRAKELARIQLEKDSKTQNEFKGGFGTAWLSDSGYLAVSYTHLDVYKRQTGITQAFIATIAVCLIIQSTQINQLLKFKMRIITQCLTND